MSGEPTSLTARFKGGEFLRFLVIGGTGALLYVALSTLVLALTALPLAVVSIGSHAALIPVMFAAQRTFTFRSGGARGAQFLKYAALQIASIAASTTLLQHFASGDWRVNMGVFAAIAASSALLSFVICRLLIFSRGGSNSSQPI